MTIEESLERDAVAEMLEQAVDDMQLVPVRNVSECCTPPYHRATRRERRARLGSRGHESRATRGSRAKTSDSGWTR